MYDILRKNLEIVPALREIVEYERNHLDPKWGDIYQHPGVDACWQWSDVSIVTSKCRKLVDLGLARVIFKSNKSTVYTLTNREEISMALDLLEENETQREKLQGVVRPLLLPDQFLSLIVGFPDIKDAVSKALQSPKPVHIMLIGPPSSAKSCFLEEIAGLPDALFVLGHSASKVGIAEELFERRPRILVIDEIDKMDRRDQDVLLSLCWSGTISEMKHGKKYTDHLDTVVFSACNNINFLSRELQSRFLKFHLKEYTRQELKEVVVATLIQREKVPEELAKFIAQAGADADIKDVRDFVRIGRLCGNAEEATKMITTMMDYSGGE